MPLEILELFPVAAVPGASPVRFAVSAAFVQVEFGQPYLRMRVPISKIRYQADTFGLEGHNVVTVVAGDDHIWWEVKLWPGEAQQLQELIEKALDSWKVD